MDANQRAIPVPQAEIIMHGTSGGQVLGKIAPLAVGAQNVHNAVDHFADIDAPFAAAGLARRDQRLDMCSFRIAQVTRIVQLVAVVAAAVFGSPHVAPQERTRHPQKITGDSTLQADAPANRFVRLIKSPDGH